jgi:myo-inositol-1(or 4)-monophosphatase
VTKTSIANLLGHVQEAAQMALTAQNEMRYRDRTYKDDGSVLTETDPQIESYLAGQIERLYPQANILGEEQIWEFDPARALTFAIDPIDGTDVYSQGMPGWCVSLGLLDRELRPIAGILCAPRWDILLFADIDKPATLNGCAISSPPIQAKPLSAKTNVMAYSRTHREVDWSSFPGKIRSVGSAALHLVSPLIYRGVYAAVEGRGAHIWDIAGAHAILRSHSLDVRYLDGTPLDYSTMVGGGPVGGPVVGASRPCMGTLTSVLAPL